MKVLYITNIPSPYRVDFFNNLADNCELKVIFDSMSAKDRSNDWFDNTKIKFKYSVIKSGRIFRLKKELKKIYDLIVVGGYSTINGLLSIQILKFKKIKFIINADGGLVAKDSFITKYLKTHFISSASYYLSTSKGTNDYLTYYGANKDSIYIYPFTSLSKCDILNKPLKHIEKKKLRKNSGFDCKRLYVSVGQFITRKGFDILLNAFNNESMKNNKLLIIGGGPLKDEYLKYIERNNIKNVYILDFVKKNELINIYKYSDVFVLPTREDIWGLVINEAMSLGLPVISTNQCLAAKELLDKRYLYECEEVDSLTKLLNEINNKSYDELYKIGEENINISKKYTIENMADEHINIFNDIINKTKNAKKLVQINSVCNGSTGKIMGEIQRLANKNGYETLSLFGRRKPFIDLNCQKFGSNFSTLLHGGLTLLFNNHGMYSYFATKRLIRKLKRFNPDIIQLHNIHGYYLNYKLLFKYLKKDFTGKVFWTLHDCWTFTGHCAHFDYIKCEKWKNSCYNCPQIKKYPVSLFFDTSKKEYKRKKECFNGVNDLTLITPSKWLKDLVSLSYLNSYPVVVINNGIDLNIFKTNIDLSIRNKYSIPTDKKIILGVSSVWNKMKGLDDFHKLSKDIQDNMLIVLVGLTEKQIKSMPNNIIGIKRTDNQDDLVKLYSLADVFVNPTLEDTYPTVNIEAIACGTPVVTYDTGGCKEQISEKTGFVCENYEDLVKKINYCIKKDFKKNSFSNKEVIQKFDSSFCYKKYIDLYDGCDKK